MQRRRGAKVSEQDVSSIEKRQAILRDTSTPCAEIAIDPGVHVGLAARDPRGDTGQWIILKTCAFWEAYNEIILISSQYTIACVYIEDARKIKTTIRRSEIEGKQRRMADNVGRVKENSRIWEEFCIAYAFNYRLLDPSTRQHTTKIKSALFSRMTGTPLKQARNALEHGRDAGMILC